MELKDNKWVLDEADIAHLKKGLSRSYQERFEMMTLLYKTHRAMNRNVISHKPLVQKFNKLSDDS
jgi:hypothetical protein